MGLRAANHGAAILTSTHLAEHAPAQRAGYRLVLQAAPPLLAQPVLP
jgi:hypothetical protein